VSIDRARLERIVNTVFYTGVAAFVVLCVWSFVVGPKMCEHKYPGSELVGPGPTCGYVQRAGRPW
jgi:hypothetical protein